MSSKDLTRSESSLSGEAADQSAENYDDNEYGQRGPFDEPEAGYGGLLDYGLKRRDHPISGLIEPV